MKRAVFTLLVLAAGGAAAHPVDEVVQAAYVTLAPGAVQLELDLTPGVQVAAALLGQIDANGDRRLSDTEAKGFARQVLSQSSLTVNGAPAGWSLDQVVMPPYENLITGNDEIKVFATARRTDRVGNATLSYQNRYAPVKSQCLANVFLLPSAGWQYAVSVQQHSDDGRSLSATYTAARLKGK